MGAGQKPSIIALNKVDKTDADNRARITSDRPVIEISAKTGFSLDKLKQCLKEMLLEVRVKVKLGYPHFQDRLGVALAVRERESFIC